MAKTTKSQARPKRERSVFLWGWLFILPTTIGLIVLNIIPIFQTIYQRVFQTGDLDSDLTCNEIVDLEDYTVLINELQL